jgi:hypothetical protein
MQKLILISNPLKRFKKRAEKLSAKKLFCFFYYCVQRFSAYNFSAVGIHGSAAVPDVLGAVDIPKAPKSCRNLCCRWIIVVIPVPAVAGFHAFAGVPAVLAWRPFCCLIIYSILPCLLLLAIPLC